MSIRPNVIIANSIQKNQAKHPLFFVLTSLTIFTVTLWLPHLGHIIIVLLSYLCSIDYITDISETQYTIVLQRICLCYISQLYQFLAQDMFVLHSVTISIPRKSSYLTAFVPIFFSNNIPEIICCFELPCN